MAASNFYFTAAWHRLRAFGLARDGHRCVLCSKPAVVVDHIRPRSRFAAALTSVNIPANLRSLCWSCDAAIKELPGSRKRRRNGQIRAKGVDVDGWPCRSGILRLNVSGRGCGLIVPDPPAQQPPVAFSRAAAREDLLPIA
jgi:hypothetical protein